MWDSPKAIVCRWQRWDLNPWVSDPKAQSSGIPESESTRQAQLIHLGARTLTQISSALPSALTPSGVKTLLPPMGEFLPEREFRASLSHLRVTAMASDSCLPRDLSSPQRC